MKVLSLGGGGVRGVAHLGVLTQGMRQGRYWTGLIDYYTGDSFGAFVSTLLACGLRLPQISKILITTNYQRLLSPIPWAIRKPMAVVKPVSLAGVAKFIDDLQLPVVENLCIGSWDAEDNVLTYFCETKPEWAVSCSAVPCRWVEKAFSNTEDHGYGRVLTRAMALPGLVADDIRWMDGGVGEHPPLSFVPTSAQVLAVTLGYAGDVPRKGGSTPGGLIDRALYAYEVTAKIRTDYALADLPNVYVLNPEIFDIATDAFDASPNKLKAIVDEGFKNTEGQWRTVKL